MQEADKQIRMGSTRHQYCVHVHDLATVKLHVYRFFAVYHQNFTRIKCVGKSDSHPTDLSWEVRQLTVWAESRLWGELGLLGRLLTGKVACECGMPESSAAKWRQLVSYLIRILKTNTCFHACTGYHLTVALSSRSKRFQSETVVWRGWQVPAGGCFPQQGPQNSEWFCAFKISVPWWRWMMFFIQFLVAHGRAFSKPDRYDWIHSRVLPLQPTESF